MRKPTRKQTVFNNIETHRAFYDEQMKKADRMAPNDGTYSIALSNRSRVENDRAYLKRGTNWKIVDQGIYPYKCYAFPIQIPSPSM